ncbi:basic proline-rich protein-like [Brachypodium distachyon]|uniref:basic proline-rich protein-like n=1 Tax=Brachypodium distachyon TaxID=15368 RepID=UPI0005300AA2|nr:basic proline-rich protein-like [Brachypodium distachyon]|eukprot:XP_010229471.1 basic proline-rich protein-like [Brachypodium distachyon]
MSTQLLLAWPLGLAPTASCARCARRRPLGSAPSRRLALHPPGSAPAALGISPGRHPPPASPPPMAPPRPPPSAFHAALGLIPDHGIPTAHGLYRPQSHPPRPRRPRAPPRPPRSAFHAAPGLIPDRRRAPSTPPSGSSPTAASLLPTGSTPATAAILAAERRLRNCSDYSSPISGLGKTCEPQ